VTNHTQQHWIANLLSSRQHPFWLRIVIAPLTIVLALVIKIVLTPLLVTEEPFLLFFAPILISAWFGGYLAGLSATLLATLLVDLLLLEPVGTLFLNNAGQTQDMILFVLEGSLISLFGGALDSALSYAVAQTTLAERHAAEVQAAQQAEAELSERLSIAQELQASEARYRTLVEHLPNIVVLMFDHDFRYLLVDGSALERHGFIKAEMEGRTLYEILPPDRVAYVAPAYQAALRGETMQLQHERDGYFYKSQFLPVRDATGHMIGGLAVVEDITQQTIVEQTLRASEQRFQAFMDHSPMLAWIASAEGQIYFANAALQRVITPPGNSMAGSFMGELFSPEFAKNQLNYMQQVVAEGVTLETIEVAQQSATGTQEYLVHIFPLEMAQGRLVGGIAVDITTQRQIENQLRTSVQEKEVLLKEIHHRVKNNLQLIISLLRLQADNTNDPTLRLNLQEAKQRIRAIASIHEKLYQSSNLAQIDFATYVRTLVTYFVRSYSSKNAAISLEMVLEELVLTVDQALACGLIIHELVSNAFKHAFPAGGNGHVSIAIKRVGPLVELDVADSGGTLSAAQFASPPTSLGLQLVNTFVAQLNGTLTLVPGPGTLIRVTFPYEEE
jgi:PAS domain S-box-containing protein